LGGFIESAVAPCAPIIIDDWSGFAGFAQRNYLHTVVPARGNMQVAETFLPIIHLVFSNLKHLAGAGQPQRCCQQSVPL
jgi:hypothetical protein